MKGFEAWVAGPWSTLALVWAGLAVGTVLGWGLGCRPRGVSRRERRALADAAAERAARQFRRLREPEVHHERRTSTAAFLAAAAEVPRIYAALTAPPLIVQADPGWSDFWQDLDRQREQRYKAWQAHEEQAVDYDTSYDADGWSEHVDQALDLANGDPITTGEIRAITEDMDAFMGRLLGEHPVPYPDGSGQ